MTTVGIVLSAGGPLGDPWHSGVLAAVMRKTGFDARDATILVGTSAGSITAVGLRAGTSPLDRLAHHLGEPLSDEGAAIFERVHTPWSEATESRSIIPMSPKMSLRAAWPPWNVDPVRFAFGMIPDGNRTAESLATRVSEIHPERWPAASTWVVAVRVDDGRRIVFGRDDIDTSIGQAVQASCAIPGVYRPTKIGKHAYIDGGLHSSTNADLAMPLGLDLVIISSVMTASESARNWITSPARAWFSRKLDAEAAAIRHSGTPVLVVQPTHEDLSSLDRHADEARASAARAGFDSAVRELDAVGGAGVVQLLSA